MKSYIKVNYVLDSEKLSDEDYYKQEEKTITISDDDLIEFIKSKHNHKGFDIILEEVSLVNMK